MNRFDEISAFHGPRKANQLLYISLRDRYIWFKNPKVASSTLGMTLQTLETRSSSFVNIQPHPNLESSVHVKPYQLPGGELEKMLVGPDFVRFAFVRNPFVRLVSGYLDKVVMKSEPEKVEILKLLGRAPEPIAQPVSWEEFVSAVCCNDPRRQNQHWLQQIYTTNAKWITLNFIGKLETFDADFSRLAQMLDINISNYYKTHVPHKTTATTSWQDYYQDPELLKSVVDYYGEDFEAFGYSTDIG